MDDVKTITLVIDDYGFEAIYVDDEFRADYDTIFSGDIADVCKGLTVKVEQLHVSEMIEDWPESLSRLRSEFDCD